MKGVILIAYIKTFIMCAELLINDGNYSDLNDVESVFDTDTNLPLVQLLSPQISMFGDSQSTNGAHFQSDALGNSGETSTCSEYWNCAHLVSLQCGLLPDTCREMTFLERIFGFGDSEVLTFAERDSKNQTSHGVKKITCVPRNISELHNDSASVKIFNSSELLQHLGSRNTTSGRCTIVLFFAPWCIFSARVAPHYNALARAFPNLDIVAIDAFHFSNLNSRFGTIAVPNVVVFHNAKAIARFNGSERTIKSLTAFVANVTGMQANWTIEITEEDYIGPLHSEPSQEPDYLLFLSWAFLILCCTVAVARSAAGIRVWSAFAAMGHHEQNRHQHID